MKPEEMREDILEELASMRKTIDELEILREVIGSKEPENYHVAAAGAYLSDLYKGVENILKRILRYKNCPIPSGDKWHSELLRMFSSISTADLPIIFDDEFMIAMRPYLGFRHLFVHGYGIMLRWEYLKAGIDSYRSVFTLFFEKVLTFVDSECASSG